MSNEQMDSLREFVNDFGDKHVCSNIEDATRHNDAEWMLYLAAKHYLDIHG